MPAAVGVLCVGSAGVEPSGYRACCVAKYRNARLDGCGGCAVGVSSRKRVIASEDWWVRCAVARRSCVLPVVTFAMYTKRSITKVSVVTFHFIVYFHAMLI